MLIARTDWRYRGLMALVEGHIYEDKKFIAGGDPRSKDRLTEQLKDAGYLTYTVVYGQYGITYTEAAFTDVGKKAIEAWANLDDSDDRLEIEILQFELNVRQAEAKTLQKEIRKLEENIQLKLKRVTESA
ncbi:MAG: hypothetical protein V4474_04465 [Patescibacteria group bacterium]